MFRQRASQLVCVAASVFLAGCGNLGPLDILNKLTPQSGYTLIANVAYGSNERQTLDVYHSNEPKSAPTVVFIFGGAWREGAKEDYEFVAHALASEGYTTVVPNYRLHPEVVYPDIVNDVRDAVVYLRDNSETLGLASTDIVLMGHSSGAHAAALLTASDEYFQDEPWLVGLIGLSGPYDLPLDLEEVVRVFPDVADPDSVNPTALATSTHPPSLLIHGADDQRVLPKHTKRYAEVLEEQGVEHTALLLEGEGHAQVVAGLSIRLEFLNDAKQDVFDFLSRYTPADQ